MHGPRDFGRTETATTITCDSCGVRIAKPRYTVTIFDSETHKHLLEVDLCPDCMEATKKAIEAV